MRVSGWYVTCDDAVCADCFGPEEAGIDAWRAAGGFENWDEPLAIFRDSESDSPTACAECGACIDHAVTEWGLLTIDGWCQEAADPRAFGNRPMTLERAVWLADVLDTYWHYGDWEHVAIVRDACAQLFDTVPEEYRDGIDRDLASSALVDALWQALCREGFRESELQSYVEAYEPAVDALQAVDYRLETAARAFDLWSEHPDRYWWLDVRALVAEGLPDELRPEPVR